MTKVIIGVDPHKLSATIEVVDRHEKVLGSGRFSTDQAGYTALRTYAKNWPERVWAIEGSNGAGRPLAQRLLEAGEHVVDVPAKLAARVRLFDTGHNRKTDARDAHSIAVVAVRTKTLRVLQVDGELEALRMLCDRRDELSRLRVQTVNRLQRLLTELVPGKAHKDLSALQAKAILATVRPRDIAGKTRRRIAAEELADLIAVEAKIKKATKELKTTVLARGSTLMDLHGVGPVVAGRTLADVGDIARFPDRNRFASWTGTAPLDASSGEQNRHRLSRAGNRRMNHMLHIAAITQIRLDTEGRAYYRRKIAAGKKPMEAMRCLKRRISDAVYRQLVADAQRAAIANSPEVADTGPGGHCGATQESSAVDLPRTSTLRISHFPDPHTRRYNRPAVPGRAPEGRPRRPRVDNKGEPVRRCPTREPRRRIWARATTHGPLPTRRATMTGVSVVPEAPGKGLQLPDTAPLLDQGGFFRPRWWSRRVPNEVREAWCGWLEELPAARTREALLDAGIPEEELDMDAWRREMARAHTGGWHRITRRNLLTACAVHHDEHRWGRTLVACYAWGTGEAGGWRGGRLGRSLSVLAPSDLLERLKAAAETVQYDPVAAYTSMLSGGPSKVGYLGSAFFTKFLYAAAAEGDGPETSGSPRPGRALILDQRVAQALNDLNGWTWPNGNHTQHQYRTWLNYADDIAASGVDDAGRPIRTDAVEYAVFLWGRELKTRPKKDPTASLAD